MFAKFSFSTKVFFAVLLLALAFALLACGGDPSDGGIVGQVNGGNPYENICLGDCSNNPVDNLGRAAADTANCLYTADNPLDCK